MTKSEMNSDASQSELPIEVTDLSTKPTSLPTQKLSKEYMKKYDFTTK